MQLYFWSEYFKRLKDNHYSFNFKSLKLNLYIPFADGNIFFIRTLSNNNDNILSKESDKSVNKQCY